MSRLRHTHRQTRRAPQPSEPQRLPQRWAIIAMATAAAATVAYLTAGPIAALTIGAGVLGTVHQVLD